MANDQDNQLTVKVTIEVNGADEEVEAWLARFALKNQVAIRESERREPVEWTPALVDRLVERITPKARKALWHISTNAPEVSFRELQRELNLDGIRVGGVMASFGFAENAGIPRPYRVDRDRRHYVIDPAVAEVVIEGIRRFEESDD